MKELQKNNIDRDLMVLEDIIEDSALPKRNWESIIEIYNQNNSSFPLSPLICAKIIEEIKDGRIPRMVFKQRGASYVNFKNRYNKSKLLIEEISSKANITEEEWQIISTLRQDPFFILGQDIDRATAFHFNDATDKLKEHSDVNAQFWLAYMKEIHKEEFTEKQDQKGVEVTINFAPGLLDSV